MVVYAKFFKGTTTLEVALGMDATAIIQTFDDFANNPDRYAVQKEARDYLEPAVSAIREIHNRYRTNPQRHPGYIDDSPSHLSHLTFPYQSNTFDLRTLYDIVAWILSVVGPVPSIATRDNYFYPLMMIGYVFCAKLIPKPISNKPIKEGKKPKPTVGPPEVWSVMWFEQKIRKRLVRRVVVGATLDHPGKSNGKSPNPKDDVQNFRKGLLDASHILADWNHNSSIVQQRNAIANAKAAAKAAAEAAAEGTAEGTSTAEVTAKPIAKPTAKPTGQDFGHCAETYPLLFICSLGQGKEAATIQRSVRGFAANASLLYTESTTKIVPYEEAEGKNNALMNPCLNCEWLLGYGVGFKISRFLLKKRDYIDLSPKDDPFHADYKKPVKQGDQNAVDAE